MSHSGPVRPRIVRGSYGRHFLDHLAAHGAGLTAGQVAVVAFLQVDADLPRCSHYILNSPFSVKIRCSRYTDLDVSLFNIKGDDQLFGEQESIQLSIETAENSV